MLSPDQFRAAINEAILRYEALPPTDENLAAIVELNSLLARLPPEGANS